jgi:hypothetical protein
MTFIWFKIKFNCYEFRLNCFIIAQHLTSKLQFSLDFTLDSVADSNYREKFDVGGFLIFGWTLITNISN